MSDQLGFATLDFAGYAPHSARRSEGSNGTRRGLGATENGSGSADRLIFEWLKHGDDHLALGEIDVPMSMSFSPTRTSPASSFAFRLFISS